MNISQRISVGLYLVFSLVLDMWDQFHASPIKETRATTTHEGL